MESCFLDVAEHLSAHTEWGMTSLFCFSFHHRFYFTYKTVLSDKLCHFYPSDSVSLWTRGRWVSSFLQGLNHNRWWNLGFQGGQCTAMQSTVSHLGWILWSWPTSGEGLYLGRAKKTFILWSKVLYPIYQHFLNIYFCIRAYIFGKSTFCYLQNRLQGIQRSWSHWWSSCCWSMTNLYWLKHHQAQKMKANQECCDLFLLVFAGNELCYSRKMGSILLSLPNV